MGSCAAPSAKGDDKFITTDYLHQCRYRRAGVIRAARSAARITQRRRRCGLLLQSGRLSLPFRLFTRPPVFRAKSPA
ncbi:TPA: hypothetical protein MFM40_005026 [Klebsiella pneumoniae]|nr:hypothetical protein [Klebsiella pneumoniae]HBW8431993.1 hypothetical protein [Klebsiella pneumoniae]